MGASTIGIWSPEGEITGPSCTWRGARLARGPTHRRARQRQANAVHDGKHRVEPGRAHRGEVSLVIPRRSGGAPDARRARSVAQRLGSPSDHERHLGPCALGQARRDAFHRQHRVGLPLSSTAMRRPASESGPAAMCSSAGGSRPSGDQMPIARAHLSSPITQSSTGMVTLRVAPQLGSHTSDGPRPRPPHLMLSDGRSRRERGRASEIEVRRSRIHGGHDSLSKYRRTNRTGSRPVEQVRPRRRRAPDQRRWAIVAACRGRARRRLAFGMGCCSGRGSHRRRALVENRHAESDSMSWMLWDSRRSGRSPRSPRRPRRRGIAAPRTLARFSADAVRVLRRLALGRCVARPGARPPRCISTRRTARPPWRWRRLPGPKCEAGVNPARSTISPCTIHQRPAGWVVGSPPGVHLGSRQRRTEASTAEDGWRATRDTRVDRDQAPGRPPTGVGARRSPRRDRATNMASDPGRRRSHERSPSPSPAPEQVEQILGGIADLESDRVGHGGAAYDAARHRRASAKAEPRSREVQVRSGAGHRCDSRSTACLGRLPSPNP